MNENIIAELGMLPWALTIALGFPTVLLLLNEWITHTDRRNGPLKGTLRSLRNFVVPSLALLLFARLVLELESDNFWLRLLESVFWILVIFSCLTFINDFVFGAARPTTWQAKVPKLFRDLTRAGLVAIGAAIVYSQVWGHEIEGAITALGVGSVVIGLALQEPLGNIVSGLMLLFERPLNIGDWIVTDGVTGKVVEVNWRSIHIETPTRETRIVPNVSLYKSAFSNLSRPNTNRTESIEIGFSYDDPPNRVKEVILELLKSTTGVLAAPGPAVRVVNYADFSITYRLVFTVQAQEELGQVRDRIMTAIWYVARREKFNIPFPIATHIQTRPDELASSKPITPKDLAKPYPLFRTVPFSDLDRVLDYASGELILQAGKPGLGFCLLVTGTVSLTVPSNGGELVEFTKLEAGSFFGDHGYASKKASEITVKATSDVKLIVVSPETTLTWFTQSPSNAGEIGNIMEARRRILLSML
jgi:small-conductance mechanosensitive channel